MHRWYYKRILKEVILPVLHWLWWHIGGEFVIKKFTGKRPNDPEYKEPPSGVLWVVGIYAAMYGIAFQVASSEVETGRLSMPSQSEWGTALGDYLEVHGCLYALDTLTAIRNVPVGPQFFRPTTVLQSIFGERVPAFEDGSRTTILNVKYAIDLLGAASSLEPIQGKLGSLNSDQPYNRVYKEHPDAAHIFDVPEAALRNSVLSGVLIKADSELLKEMCADTVGSPAVIYAEDYRTFYACIVETIRRHCYRLVVDDQSYWNNN